MYEPLMHVVLYQPEIPYNAGNIGRTCVAVGAKLWMVRPLGFSTDDYYLRRAGMDYWKLLNWETVDDWTQLLERLPEAAHGYHFTKTATRAYTDVRYAQGDCVIFGRESAGLPQEMISAAGERALRIPMRSEMRSLNLSNTAAIVLYEACRQNNWVLE